MPVGEENGLRTHAEWYAQALYAWTQATAALVQAGKWRAIDSRGGQDRRQPLSQTPRGRWGT